MHAAEGTAKASPPQAGGVAVASGSLQRRALAQAAGGFTAEQRAMLDAPPPAHEVKTRKGPQGRQLSYVEGRYAIETANRVFGFAGWDRATVETRFLHQGEDVDEHGNRIAVVSYMAKVKVTVWTADGEAVEREGSGFGSGTARPGREGDAHEGAIKEAETDAMKRAFVTFGEAFGLGLYRKERAAPAPAAKAAAPATDSRKLDALEGALKGVGAPFKGQAPAARGAAKVPTNTAKGPSNIYEIRWNGHPYATRDPARAARAAERAMAAAASERRLDRCYRDAVRPLLDRLASSGEGEVARRINARYAELKRREAG